MDPPSPDGTTALVVRIPEADAAIGAIRAAHDPSARRGMPAHVTILYPFVPESAWRPGVDARLAALFAAAAPFDTAFRRTGSFGAGSLHLAPEPAEPFAALTRAVAAAFPDRPPYGGAFADVVPHLTLADGAAPADVAAAEAAHARTQPFTTRVAEVALVVKRGGTWTFDRAWALGSADAAGAGPDGPSSDGRAAPRPDDAEMHAPSPRPLASEDPRIARFAALCAVMERLRAPGGCPWDRKQTLATLWPYLREELEEAAAASPDVETGRLDPDELREELGDLLFNVVFVAEVARERGWFSMADVVAGAEAKIRRRHPHIWGDLSAKTPEEVERIWAAVKAEEKAEKERRRGRRGT